MPPIQDETELVPTSMKFLNSPSSACGGTHLSKKLCYFSKAHADTPTPRYADTPNDHVS
jgi:hypothetical protein